MQRHGAGSTLTKQPVGEPAVAFPGPRCETSRVEVDEYGAGLMRFAFREVHVGVVRVGDIVAGDNLICEDNGISDGHFVTAPLCTRGMLPVPLGD